MKQELVSIITANYNAEKFIAYTIESVLSQTYENWEIIIVDDCSSDRSVEIINSYSKNDRRIRLIQLENNSGPAVARNRAIEEAKGRYIAFLDSDDIWLSHKLSKQIAFMQESNVEFSYTSYALIDEENNDIGTFLVPKRQSYYELLKTCSIGCLSVVYDTVKLGKVKMPLILKRQDYGLWLKLLRIIPYAYGMKEVLAVYRIRKNSVSSNKLIAAKYQWKIYREVEGIGLIKSIYYFLFYTFNGLKKYH